MAWDSTRPVPWMRLVREWLLYVGIMAVVFVVFFRDDGLAGIFAGLLVSGPLYLGVGFVLAKLGYRRQSFGELRAQRRQATESTPTDSDTEGSDDRPRARPAPTRRTGGGGSQRKKPKRKR